MKYKYLSFFVLLALSTCYVVAQDSGSKFSVSILFGKGQTLSGNNIPASPTTNGWSVNGLAPSASGISFENSLVNMTGAEFRYFVVENIAIKLSGSGIMRNTPMQENIPGVIEGNINAAWIPDYEATKAENSFDANLSLGGEYHFKMANKLSPYLGVAIPFCYSRYSQYDPTAIVDITNPDIEQAVKITDVGMRHIEALGFGGQIVSGADYSLSESLYLGFEIKPFSYLYAINTKYPAPGLEARSADSHTFGFFTQPVLKLGIRF